MRVDAAGLFLINKSNKPVFYIVNNDFIKAGEKFKQLDKTKLKCKN